MSITERQIFLIQSSFRRLMPYSEKIASLFYKRLFELDPSLKALFKSDMQEQKRKLMYTLSILVTRLDNLNMIVPMIQHLGKQHSNLYGVKQEHYSLVGEALLWTLEQQLQNHFDAEVKAAWSDLYKLLAATTVEAAYSGKQ